MKILKPLLVLAISSLFLTNCKKENATIAAQTIEKTAISADAKLATTNFKIEGITCAVGCAKTIEKELAETAGVKSASVDFDKKTAKVEFDANAQTSEKIVEIVEKTGDGKTYKVSDVTNSQDKAMLFRQDDPKKSKNKKDDKTTYTTTAAKATTVIQSEKPAGKGCCAAKKHCSGDEKKENL